MDIPVDAVSNIPEVIKSDVGTAGLSVRVGEQSGTVTRLTLKEGWETKLQNGGPLGAAVEYRVVDEDTVEVRFETVEVTVETDTESANLRLSFAGVSDLQERTARHPCGDRWPLRKPTAAGLLFLASTVPSSLPAETEMRDQPFLHQRPRASARGVINLRPVSPP